jgi:hypothetical protein
MVYGDGRICSFKCGSGRDHEPADELAKAVNIEKRRIMIYEKASIFCLDDGHLFSAHHAYRLQEAVKVKERVQCSLMRWGTRAGRR